MKTSQRSVVALGIVCGGLLLGALCVQAAPSFNDPTKVNVLREFIYGSTTNLVTGTTASHMDGSGAGDNILNPSGHIQTNTYILPGLRTVSRMDFDYAATFDAPDSMTVYGSTDGGATFPITLTTYTPNPNDPFIGTSFAPQTVNAVRTVATLHNNSGNYYNRTAEARLYLDSSVSHPMYGDYAGAFNYLADLWSAGKITVSNSPNTAVWNAPEVGGGAVLFDADMWQLSGIRDSLTADPTQRVYVKLTLDTAYQMNYATLGSDSSGNQWGAFGNAEFYTNNGALLDPSGLGSASSAALTGQGWVLQKAWTADASNAKSFLLSQPGLYNQILLVWDEGGASQSGRLTNLEIFASMPEPASLSLLALGGFLLARRRARG